MKKVQEKLINFVKKGQYKGLCELIEKEKIDLNFKDNYGTPLTHLAVSHPDILEYLLNHGTRIDLIDQYGNTALHEAAIKGISDSIQLLIKRGANINFQNHWQATPLPLSAQFNKINSMKLCSIMELKLIVIISSITHQWKLFLSYISMHVPLNKNKS